ncbi:MAG TPA: hypothetical protein DDY78_27480 [Planctomycetales bacterium]|nr:hypothetical protein [Planctomycetales bacterium]
MFVTRLLPAAALALGLFLTASGASALALGDPAGVADKPVEPVYLQKYRVRDQQIEAGFVPEETVIVLGEPPKVAFTVKNLSDKPFSYAFGGDYRGAGRHERFKVSALDAGADPLRDPVADKEGRSFNGEGPGGLRQVKPGDAEKQELDLGQYRTFDKPGVYTVTCRFGLEENFGAEKAAATVETTFRLTILPRTDENVRRVVGRLVGQAGRSHKEVLAGVIAQLCSFARKQAVPDLATMAAEGDAEHRVAALGGLGRFTTPVAEAAVLKALRDPNEAIRAAAAAALGEMKTDAAVAALLGRLPGEKPAVAGAVLRAMGTTQSPRVFERLEKALADEDADVRRAAVRGLALYGGDRAIAVLKRCASDEDLVRREAAVQALESLRQPLQAQWLQPLILAGRRYGYPTNDGPNPNEALRLLRMYAGDEAAPAMVICLDFENPAVRSYYNYVILGALEATPSAPKVTWHNDPNADGTPQQIEENRKTLEKLRAWLAERENARRVEEGPMEKLAARLGDDEFEVREKASRELEAGGTAALPALLRAAALSGDAEVRIRARRVMDSLWRRWKTQLPQG